MTGAMAAPANDLALSEAMIEIATGDGACEAFFVHPASGRHPGVLFWPDGIGMRDAIRDMARRLAARGYAVFAPNQFYRDARLPLNISFGLWENEAERARLMAMIGAVTPERTARDAAVFVAFLDDQPAVDTARGIGTQGYCMGGALAVRTAAAVPGRVRAVASFHGGGLVQDGPDSPHRLLAATRAAYLIAVARNDDEQAPADKDVLRDTAAASGIAAEIEVYPADHGWCAIDAPMYDHDEAERAFARLLALYANL